MKCIVLAVLAFTATLEAKPFGVLGLGGIGSGIGSGLGSGVGTGVGLATGLGIEGAEALGSGIIDAAEMGTGIASGVGRGLVSGLGNGLGMAGIGGVNGGRQEYDNVARGNNQEGFYNRGNNGYHNRGQHSNRVTSITTSEQNEGHDVGAHNNFADGGNQAAGYNRLNHGDSAYEGGMF